MKMSEKSLEKRILGFLGANAVAAGLAAVLAFYTPSDAEARERNTPKLGMKRVDYKTLAKRAEKLNEEKKYQEAINLLKPYEKGANEWLFFKELGGAYMKLKRMNEALPPLEKAYELNPKDHAVLVNYAIVLYRNEKYEKSIKIAQEYIDNGYTSKIKVMRFIIKKVEERNGAKK
jgi:tetratricopeptide (TPR) repeat protein